MGDRHSRGASSVLTQFSCFFLLFYLFMSFAGVFAMD